MADIEKADLSGHTFGHRDELTGRPALCPQCIDETGRPGVCDHARYTRRLLAFATHPLHIEALEAAHYSGDGRAASNELARQRREFQTLPARHLCSCRCPNEARNFPACADCKAIREFQKVQESIEQGRGSHVEAPMPDVFMLDLVAGYAAA